MMLNKAICKHCWESSDFADDNFPNGWTIDDDRRWHAGILICHHLWDCGVPSTVEIDGKIDDCPYKLEHVVSEGMDQ